MSTWESERHDLFNGNAQQVDAGPDFAFDLREEQPFELPARLFEQLPFAIYVCGRDGLVVRYNRRAAEL
jgi:PAS domain-containing protein